MPLDLPLPEAGSPKPMSAVQKGFQSQEARLLLSILVGGALLAWQSDAFLTVGNFRSVLFGFSFVAIATLGQLLVVLTGRIDLSAGSVMGLAGMVTALLLAGGTATPIAIACGIGAGGLIGLLNGLFSVSFGVSSFIVTLGSLQIARGICIALSNGRSVSDFPSSFLAMGTTFGLPIPVWILLLLSVLLAGGLRYTAFGRELYAIGGNESAARLAGVAVKPALLACFVASGVAAGLAGVLMTARLGAALGNAATGYELTVIASVVIGGASLTGGKGSVTGALLGSILIALVNNALVLLTVPTYWQQTFIGAVILCAALVDRIRR